MRISHWISSKVTTMRCVDHLAFTDSTVHVAVVRACNPRVESLGLDCNEKLAGPKLSILMTFGCLITMAMIQSACFGQEEWLGPDELRKRVNDAFQTPANCKKLDPVAPIWFDRDEQAVVMDGYVVQREVPLELFACPVGTKEHESVVAVFARPRIVHAALLAINAKPGSPASFEPFKPASGTTVRVYVLWYDSEKKPQSTLAQNWVRRVDNKKAMPWDWVFAGSRIFKDEEGKEHYLGDSGELISVSNFATSTMDVAVKSDQANASLLFEAFKDNIPPRNTPVRLVLSLTDERPYGTYSDSEADTKGTPKYLSEKTPKRILNYLEPQK